MQSLVAFDEQVTAAIVEACEKASQSMRDWGQPEGMRETLARRIVELASKGERNPDRLCEHALRSMGFSESPRLQPAAADA
ncbi:MAG TPA: hypothetical protein VGF60_05265 [Xanthobacteraceae bacterium]|jgi:hypothetical protein